MNKTKKYVTIAAVLLCVCAAVYLNWSYNNSNSSISDAELANASSEDTLAHSAIESSVSDYFASARLTRQQSRDEALNLLESAAASEAASQETIDGAMNAIAAMANYSMMETQIENLLLAKNFAECVAFISADGVTLAVPAPGEGLTADSVAKITDAVIAETDFNATQIKIIEVKSNLSAETSAEDSDVTRNWTDANADESALSANDNANSSDSSDSSDSNPQSDLPNEPNNKTMTEMGEILE